MNVITGETGAGKTMVVTGLGLLFGGRADAGPGARRRRAARWWRGGCGCPAPLADAVAGRVAEAGAELDDDGRCCSAAR